MIFDVCEASMSKTSANIGLLNAAWEICLMALDSSCAKDVKGDQTRMHGGTLDNRVKFPGKCISEGPSTPSRMTVLRISSLSRKKSLHELG